MQYVTKLIQYPKYNPCCLVKMKTNSMWNIKTNIYLNEQNYKTSNIAINIGIRWVPTYIFFFCYKHWSPLGS